MAKRLNRPWGVCVSGQYVYVSNHDGHYLSFATHVQNFNTISDSRPT